MICGGLVTLFVKDVGASIRFYVETLGMKLVEEEGSSWAVIDAGDGLRIALRSGRRETMQASTTLGLVPKLPLRDAVAILENRGVTFTVTDTGSRTLASFEDIDGNGLYLFEKN